MIDTSITNNQLNAFIDNQLDSSEKARVLEAIRTNQELADYVQSLQNNKDMLILTYSDTPSDIVISSKNTVLSHIQMSIAASIMLILSGILGWFSHTYLGENTSPTMKSIASFDLVNEKNDRVLLHINNMDEEKINQVLNVSEMILSHSDNSKKPLQLEIVANASGLGLLRDGSPYQNRIKSITNKHMNVSFLACGIAMENARLKEGKNVKLIPEAKKINSAIDKILGRIKGGWTYVQG